MQFSPNREGAYEHYMDDNRHWCPRSEQYTGADSLISALRRGWVMTGSVYREDIFLRGNRHTTVFHFELRDGDTLHVMSVISNPFLMRFLQNRRLQILMHIEPNNVIQFQNITAAMLA